MSRLLTCPRIINGSLIRTALTSQTPKNTWVTSSRADTVSLRASRISFVSVHDARCRKAIKSWGICCGLVKWGSSVIWVCIICVFFAWYHCSHNNWGWLGLWIGVHYFRFDDQEQTKTSITRSNFLTGTAASLLLQSTLDLFRKLFARLALHCKAKQENCALGRRVWRRRGK